MERLILAQMAMSALRAGMSAARAPLRIGIPLFVIAWLGVQIIVPLARKFDRGRLEYRYATFSWAMFSREPVTYSVTLYQIGKDGRREPIPQIDQVARGFSEPSQRRSDSYRSVEQIKAWHQALLEHIATHSHTSETYGVSIHWIGGDGVDAGSQWELTVPRVEAQ